MIKKVQINTYEKGFLFKDNELIGLLDKGRHIHFSPFKKIKIDVMSLRDPWIVHPDLDLIIKSGIIKEHAVIIDLKDSQRALVWIDKRFSRVLGPGRYALWTGFCDITIEKFDTESIILEHKEAHTISKSPYVSQELDIVDVVEGHKGLFFKNGRFEKMFDPGRFLFWKNRSKIKFYHVDMREKVIDISGQEIISSDKVTLRLNVVLCYRVIDPLKSVTSSEDCVQALYREAQLAVRAVIGTHDIDTLLSDKDKVAGELETVVKKRSEDYGISIVSLGIRDIILPGEMKTLLNRVIEAKKAADANLITRREETAAIRSQANTAKILENNPTLMRLRELDLLEKIASDSKMSIVLGEKGLGDRIMNLL